jgi:hypothetical protein
MGDLVTRVLPQMDGSDLSPLGFLMSSAWTLVLRTPELPNAEIPDTILLRDFRSAYEGLNLELLSTDLTAVGYSERDPMLRISSALHALFHCSLDVKSSTVQISSAESDDSCAPPELWRFLPGLGRIPNVQRPRPLFFFPL